MKNLIEKLLPARWWKKPPPLNDEQFWSAMASPVNPQTQAVLHVATDKFVQHMQMASDLEAPGEKRLRALDRAMAVADFLNETDNDLAGAKAELERRAALKEEAQEDKPA